MIIRLERGDIAIAAIAKVNFDEVRTPDGGAPAACLSLVGGGTERLRGAEAVAFREWWELNHEIVDLTTKKEATT